jgi:hypothetical protein
MADTFFSAKLGAVTDYISDLIDGFFNNDDV